MDGVYLIILISQLFISYSGGLGGDSNPRTRADNRIIASLNSPHNAQGVASPRHDFLGIEGEGCIAIDARTSLSLRPETIRHGNAHALPHRNARSRPTRPCLPDPVFARFTRFA
jgi:hypothetical protein